MGDDHDLLIRMDEKLTQLSIQFIGHVTQETKERSDLSQRVDRLEEWKWKWAGAMAVSVFLLTLLGNVAARLVTR